MKKKKKKKKKKNYILNLLDNAFSLKIDIKRRINKLK